MSTDLTIDFNLQFAFRFDEEAKVHVGFCPLLGIYSQGTTDKEAEEAVASAAALFIGTCYDRDILHSVLRERGMKKVSSPMLGPVTENKQYIAVSGFDRIVERSIPIHLIASMREGMACQ